MVASVFDGTVVSVITASSNQHQSEAKYSWTMTNTCMLHCTHAHTNTMQTRHTQPVRITRSLQRYGSDKAEIAPHEFVFGI
jgi:MoaA/NifB/PqqE/SkfB family radical SAM enzyme